MLVPSASFTSLCVSHIHYCARSDKLNKNPFLASSLIHKVFDPVSALYKLETKGERRAVLNNVNTNIGKTQTRCVGVLTL